jgi:poly(3-hydroxybutyrate) depolymerase
VIGFLVGYLAGFGSAWLVGYVLHRIDRRMVREDAEDLLALIEKRTAEPTVARDPAWWASGGKNAH